MKPSRVLMDAQAILMTDGWLQGWSGEPGGPRCLVAALDAASGNSKRYLAARLYLIKVLDLARAAPDFSISSWQDRSGRTFDEVFWACEAAIDAALEDEE